jgi:hypothetical protein
LKKGNVVYKGLNESVIRVEEAAGYWSVIEGGFKDV